MINKSLNLTYTKVPYFTNDTYLMTYTQSYRNKINEDGTRDSQQPEALKIESISIPSFTSTSIYNFTYAMTSSSSDQAKILKIKILKSVLFDSKYSIIIQDKEDSIEMKVLELIFQVAVTTPNPIESYVKYVNISIPFTDLDYDTKIEDSPLEVYKCTTFRNYMALEDIYSDYMKVEIQHSHQIKYWSIKE